MRTAILRGLTLPGPSAIRSAVHSHIDALARREWNALGDTHIPFLRHEFLGALEHTHCVGASTGWEPRYFALSDDQGLAAALPAYVKLHSYGEFVFDFAWAQAYARAGGNYYPKLTIAVPFTPATGPRLLLRPGADPALAAHFLALLRGKRAEVFLETAVTPVRPVKLAVAAHQPPRLRAHRTRRLIEKKRVHR